jgi:hypothetical protein
MDSTIKNLIVGAVIIAAVAVLIAMAATYWYVIVGLGIAAFVVYKFMAKQKDERNKV